LVIAVRQRLVAREPETLEEKKRQQSRRDALRLIEAKTAKTGKPWSHLGQRERFQSKRWPARVYRFLLAGLRIGAILLGKGLRLSSFFTIGHSNHTMDIWRALLRQHGVQVVVDARSSPYSKYVPQFDKELMKRSLEETGISYLFLGAELGGRPANPAYYDAKGRVLYSRLHDDARFQSAIARLETGIERFRVAVVCGEENPANCHRRLLIGRVLTEHGHTMLHIRGDGRLESDETVAAEAGKPLVDVQPALFAELDEDQWRSTASVLPKRAPASSSAH
jgi:hypothetical protein